MTKYKQRIIIAGGRDFADYNLLKDTVDKYIETLFKDNPELTKDEIIIISGVAEGADTMGAAYAFEKGYKVKPYPAEWGVHGRSAGALRNMKMAQYASKENGTLIVFWNGRSKGTLNMIKNALMYHLKIIKVMY